MRVAVFGGTGHIGRRLVELVLADGHEVVALARNPGKLDAREGLRVVPASLDDPTAVAEVIRGADVVLSVLGPGARADEMPSLVAGYRHIVAAMHEHGVRRLVLLGTPSITDPYDGKEWRVSLMVRGIRRFRPFAYDAITEIGRLVRDSGLQWTIVRIPLLTNNSGDGQVHVRMVGGGGGAFVSRQNAAAYFHRQLTGAAQVGRAPLISDLDLAGLPWRSPGFWLQALAVAHAGTGVLTYREPLAEIGLDGVVNAVPDRGDRATAFWFLGAAPLLWLAGRLLRSAEASGDRAAQRSAGAALTTCGVVGSAAMPNTGFWAVAGLGVWALRRGRRRGR